MWRLAGRHADPPVDAQVVQADGALLPVGDRTSHRRAPVRAAQDVYPKGVSSRRRRIEVYQYCPGFRRSTTILRIFAKFSAYVVVYVHGSSMHLYVVCVLRD